MKFLKYKLTNKDLRILIWLKKVYFSHDWNAYWKYDILVIIFYRLKPEECNGTFLSGPMIFFLFSWSK